MRKIALLLVIFFLHVEASDDTQVGTFDSGVSSEKVKIGKRYKAPIKEAQTYSIDINNSEIEGIAAESIKSKKEVKVVKKEKNELLKVTKKEEHQKVEKHLISQSEVTQNESGGVVLPFDKADKKNGVVLPMDEEKSGGFFSIFGF